MQKLLVITTLFGAVLLGEERAVVVNAAAPGYPRSVVTLEGEVLVDLEVAPEGIVRKAQAQSGPPVLRTAAENAARRWLFMANGPDRVQVVFAFILQEGIGDPPQVASVFKAPNRLEVFAMKRKVEVISDPPVEVIKKPKKRNR